MTTPVPISCETSDLFREGMRSGISRDVDPDIIAIDFFDGDTWVLTDYRATVESGGFGCWHVLDGGRMPEATA